jgi:hypothetical protein
MEISRREALGLVGGGAPAALARSGAAENAGWGRFRQASSAAAVDGVELAHNLNGVEQRDPDRQHSFYIDAGGGRTRLVCTEVRVLRATPDLAEVAFVDNTSPQLRHEHHLIMRRGRRGLYGYDILTAVVVRNINEVRMNARWDRSILDHAYNWERGKGQQPTYAYLAKQTPMGDETWLIDGVNNPDLPSPQSNAGNLPPGTVYTKYNWSLYHHENPMFGHYGHGIARAEIEENRAGSDWVDDPFYPPPASRSTVTGRLRIADERPPGGYWVLLSTQDATDVFAIHEPTYFVSSPMRMQR